jgi:hypothetical protein
VIDLGHELFIWFAFLPLLLRERDGIQKISDLLRSFLSSPVVIAILLSLLFNVLGWQEALDTLPITGGIMAALGFLANLTIPLILITVGYGIKLDRKGLGDASRLVIIRLAILLPQHLSDPWPARSAQSLRSSPLHAPHPSAAFHHPPLHEAGASRRRALRQQRPHPLHGRLNHPLYRAFHPQPDVVMRSSECGVRNVDQPLFGIGNES